MPRFYGLTNNNAEKDWPKNYAEIHAITHYLFAKSTPPADFVDPPAKTDPAKGKELFLQKGCLACHQHRPYQAAEVQLADRESGATRPTSWTPPRPMIPRASPRRCRNTPRPTSARTCRTSRPSSSRRPQGLKWLSNWIAAPGEVSSQELDAQPPALGRRMPPTSRAGSSRFPAEWPVKVEVPACRIEGSQGGRRRAGEALCLQERQLQESRRQDRSPSRSARSTTWSTRSSTYDEKLLYLGEKTISRLGCFGCHTIPGFENAKPIGTALNDWGIKSPARLDFGHIKRIS